MNDEREDAIRLIMLNAHEKIMEISRNCTTCLHWREHEICAKFSERPPARIIIVGCEAHTDLIPFEDGG